MEELQQEQQEQFGDAEPAAADGSEQQAAAAEGADNDDSECLDGYDGGCMSSIERQLLASSLELVAAATATLKAFGRALLQVGGLRVGLATKAQSGSIALHLSSQQPLLQQRRQQPMSLSSSPSLLLVVIFLWRSRVLFGWALLLVTVRGWHSVGSGSRLPKQPINLSAIMHLYADLRCSALP